MSTNTTNLNIRIDKELKQQAEVFFSELGLNMTTAINIFVRQSLRQGKIPFEISSDPFYSPSNVKALKHSLEQLKKGQVITKTIEELEQMTNG
jgi:DNA-damage-inducible protein J